MKNKGSFLWNNREETMMVEKNNNKMKVKKKIKIIIKNQRVLKNSSIRKNEFTSVEERYPLGE